MTPTPPVQAVPYVTVNNFVPSGAQYRISFLDHSATITQVGAAVREYSVAGRPVFTPFAPDEMAPAFHGAVLVPWPNRLRDGAYEFDGTEYRVQVNEHARSTALHGLTCWQRWTAVDVSESAVTLELALAPSPGYPFGIVSRVTYGLDEGGLRVRVATRNVGTARAPYGVGFHPWLSPAGADLDECEFRLDAATRVTTDDRLLPVGSEPVAGDFDLRAPRPLRGVDLDDAFLDPIRDADGLSWARLTAPDGRTAALWMDGSMDTWQVCTGDHIDDPALRRTGVAAEPMSCIADAFRTGDRLVVLEPGDEHVVTWGATLI